MKITGIYNVKSKATGRIIFSGGAYDIEWDWFLHLDELRRGNHPDEKVETHFKKYGFDDYEIVVVERFDVIGRATLMQKAEDYKKSLMPKVKEEPKVEPKTEPKVVPEVDLKAEPKEEPKVQLKKEIVWPKKPEPKKTIPSRKKR